MHIESNNIMLCIQQLLMGLLMEKKKEERKKNKTMYKQTKFCPLKASGSNTCQSVWEVLRNDFTMRHLFGHVRDLAL